MSVTALERLKGFARTPRGSVEVRVKESVKND